MVNLITGVCVDTDNLFQKLVNFVECIVLVRHLIFMSCAKFPVARHHHSKKANRNFLFKNVGSVSY